jgi:hypothetical protein
VAIICNMFRAVAIEVYLKFEHALFEKNSYFLFHLYPVTAKVISVNFDKKQCGSNKIFLLIMRQFICAPNLRSVKSFAARTRKKSLSSWSTWIRSASIDAGNFDASLHHCLHCIAHCQSNRLLILLERAEIEIPFRIANDIFKKNWHRSQWTQTNA